MIQLHEDCGNNFVLTGSSPTPVQVELGVIVERKDLNIYHEEADMMLTNQSFNLW